MSDAHKKEVPTATHLLKKEIDRFLASDAEEVLCIRGKWGVGKTYAWNSYLKEAATNGSIALERYAYVSLFGVQSLDELRYSIFENTVGTKDISAEPSIENFIANTTAVVSRLGRHSLSSIINYIPFVKNGSQTLKIVSFLTVTRQIVCIDDIERKGRSLRTQDVLGLVSFLRDSRKCKVVLILNDEELDGEDKTELAKFQEKVIDISLVFAPNENDCVEIALPERRGVLAKLAERAIALHISNIRIIKKIERLVCGIEPLLMEYDPVVLEQAIQTLTLFGWAHYGRTEDKSDRFVEFVIKKRGRGWYGTTDEKKLTDEESKWDQMLDTYGFRVADELDIALLDGIKNGFFDEELIQRFADKLDQAHKAARLNQSFSDAWRMFHDSFDNNETEVLKTMAEAFDNNIRFISPSDVNAIMNLFKKLGHGDIAKDALDAYMTTHDEEEREFYDLENYPFVSGSADDPDLKEAFAKRLAAFEVAVNPAEILNRISINQAWSNRDITALSSMSVADYKDLFKRLRGADLRAAARTAVGFQNIANRGHEYDSIIENAKQALAEIAKESTINGLRIQRMVGDL
jgi:hypothetical protein